MDENLEKINDKIYSHSKALLQSMGYELVAETNEGASFANTKIELCVILLKEYNEGEPRQTTGQDLLKTLTSKYPYGEKGTIAVIIDTKEDKEKILRDPYFYQKRFVEDIATLPSKPNKDITITFQPMKDANDKGDYFIDPFDEFDGKCCGAFVTFLSQVNKNCTVKYPKIVTNSWFRYYANKMYTIISE